MDWLRRLAERATGLSARASDRLPPTLTRHAGSRGALALAVTALALGLRCASPSPPERTSAAVAAMLGSAARGTVGPDDFIWEEREGFLSDTVRGRSVVFRAAPRGGGGEVLPGDIYRARVRLTRGGRPIGVERVVNLTRTPHGDDRDLAARGHHVAFATRAYGAVQGVTVLDLRGDHPAREARTLTERARAATLGWLEAGSWRGVLRTEVAFATPPSEVRLELTEGALVMALGPEAEPAAVDLATAALNPGPRNPYGASAQVIPHPVIAPAPFLVRALREGVGARPAGFAAGLVAAARDVRARAAAGAPEPAAASVDPPAPSIAFPPEPLRPLLPRPLEGEGAWRPAPAELVQAVAGGAPPGAAGPYLADTLIRPDPEAPRSVVRLVAIDTRQLDLRFEAGVIAPPPLVGPRGSGRVHLVAGATEKVVAAFNGGAAWGDLGLADAHRIFAPPLAGAPTLAIHRDGAPAIGVWSGAIESLLPEQGGAPRIASLRQGPPPRAADAGHHVDRSALCVTGGGHLVYAWATDVTERTLARALEQGGCARGAAVALASGPAPAGLAYLGPRADAAAAPSRLVDPAMTFAPDRIWDRSANDFFYLVLRDPRPRAPLAGGAEWLDDGGVQPAPAWLTGVHHASVTELGAQVRLVTFAPGRFVWRIRSGFKELRHRNGGTFPGALSAEDQARVVAAIGVASGRRRGPRGLALEGSVGLNLRGDAGVLAVDRDAGRIAIGRSGDLGVPAGGDLTELPLTAEDGKLLPEAREVGSMRARSAACTLVDGTLVVAATTFDSDEATTESLLSVGCTRVVALDRGSHLPAFIHRAGTSTPPVERYEATTLYAIEAPMRGRARVGLD